jgi:hypothetical protein
MGYWNEIDKRETREIIQQDCYRNRAEADTALEAQGRFKRQNETRITGSGTSNYPAITSGPWSGSHSVPGDPHTDELGYDINEVEAVLPTPAPIPTETILADGSDRVGAEAVVRSVLVHDTAAVASTHAPDAPTTPLDLRGGDVGAGVGALSPIAAHSHSPSPKRWRRF